MINKNSFRTIRSFSGSQQGGFEELICQLAHLDRPPNAKSFIRKEGAGGDAGVECYWKMEDGSEHAWQAKYFIDEITPSRWEQIDESVKTALAKHPDLKKYYVCTPADRTDTRSTGSRGKKKISVLDEWNQKVKGWSDLALKRGRQIEFEYWGAHEILLPLQTDDPKYSGRALFWFNAVVLTTQKFKRCIEKQERTLGERYTPDFHVDLPIAKTLGGLTNGDSFWEELNQKALDWNEDWESFCRLDPPSDVTVRHAQLLELLDNCRRSIDLVVLTRDRNRLSELQQEAEDATTYILEFENYCKDSDKANKRPNDHSRSYRDEVFNFAYRNHSKLTSFLNSNYVNANVASAILVTGEPGAGKSHLLCDFAIDFVNSHCPAILMLGQHYRGGNPLADLLDLLDLNGHSYETVLGAIDAAGEAARVNAILLIDAINEGSHRNEWRDRIVGLLEDVKRFPHISVVISCRARFDALLIPSHIKPAELLRITHEGFRGHEHRAAAIYLTRQGIAKPTTPITAPEFSNPLFLKTCASALKDKGETIWPKGYQGTSRLFEIYLSSLETVVSRKRGTEVNDKLCQKALEAIANAMFPNRLFGLPWDEAAAIVNVIDTCVNPVESLFQSLLREGALAEDVEYELDNNGNYAPQAIVRFAFERFCDQFIAQKLLSDLRNPAQLFHADHPIGKSVAENKYSQFEGILAALSIIVPEKFGVEFWDLLPDAMKSDRHSEDFYFFETLPYRSPTSFTTKTVDLFNSLQPDEYKFQNRKLDLLVEFATEPTHPWNSERLHKILLDWPMPKRDSLWSVYVAKNDYAEEGDQPESAIRSIIEWATFGDLSFVGEEQSRLSLITLIWFTTTTYRKTRDQATKAASRMFASFPSLVVPLLKTFQNVDDLYLQERLYASAYGGLCNAVIDDHLKAASQYVFESQFNDNSPTAHILLRDYARGIIELALARVCLDESVVIEKCRPPYRSEWPLENPPAEGFNRLGSKIERSVFYDDFGRYTMGSVHNWSPTSLNEPRPESEAQILEALIANLDETSKKLFSEAVKVTQEHEIRSWRGHLPKPGSQAINEIVEELLLMSDFPDIQEAEAEDSEGENIPEELSSDLPNAQASESLQPTREEADAAWKIFKDSLDDSRRAIFDWAQGFWRNGDITASFNQDWANRWVCKHAIELGWTIELFDEFEKSLPYNGRERPRVERIGKKYQRIAFHVFLAHLADNVHYKGDEGYSDTKKPSLYRGPWQPWERDLDPTHWLRKTSDSGWGEWSSRVWWRPFDYKFRIASDAAKRQWCEDPADLPKFELYIKVLDESDVSWYSLRGFSSWREKEISGDNSELTRDIWFRINSIIVTKSEFPRLQLELANKDYISSDLISSTSTGHQAYLREYPWHPSADIQDRFEQDEAWGEIKSPHIVPYVEYEWEKASGDDSAEMNLSLYIPSSFLIEKLNLKFDRTRFDRWIDRAGRTVFVDPSVEFDGPSFALLDCRSVDKMLANENLLLMWLIGGEKMIINESKNMVEERMVFNSMLWTTGDGQIHTKSHHYMEGR